MDEDKNSLEMMIWGKAADAIKQEYIEEPSFRKSMFKADAEDISVTWNLSIPHTVAVFMMIIAFLAFSIVTICFKAIYLNYRHTIWEDIYGRGIAFFICSTLSYLVNGNN